MDNFRIVSIISLIILLSTISVTSAQTEMTVEQYNAELARQQNREAEASRELKQIEAEIAQISSETEKAESEIDATWDKIYQLIEAKESEVMEFRKKLDELERRIDALSANFTSDSSDAQKKMNHNVAKCWKNKASALSDVNGRLSKLEKKMVILNLKKMSEATKEGK